MVYERNGERHREPPKFLAIPRYQFLMASVLKVPSRITFMSLLLRQLYI